MADQCGYLALEQGGHVLLENGDNLVTECFIAPSTSLLPGKVWKGEYPYFRQRRPAKPYSPPYGPKPYSFREEEEILLAVTSELD